VRSDAELLCALVESDVSEEEGKLLGEIREQMPEGCEIISVELEQGKVGYNPVWAEYEFELGDVAESLEFKSGFERFRSTSEQGEKLCVERKKGKKGPVRKIDVSDYIDSVELEGREIAVRCNITKSGSVRVDEILELLGIERSQLSGPIRRRAVGWRKN
jgi:hypothetical protein